jgi:hypothetical protein
VRHKSNSKEEHGGVVLTEEMGVAVAPQRTNRSGGVERGWSAPVSSV